MVDEKDIPDPLYRNLRALHFGRLLFGPEENRLLRVRPKQDLLQVAY